MIEAPPPTLAFTEDILARSYDEVRAGLDQVRAEEIAYLEDNDRALADLFGDLIHDSMAAHGDNLANCSKAGFVVAARAVRYAAGETPLPPHSDNDVKIYYGLIAKRPHKLGADFEEIYADQTPVLDLTNNRLSNELSRFAAKLVFTLNGLTVSIDRPMYRISQLVPAIPVQRTAQQRVFATRELKKSRARFGLTR